MRIFFFILTLAFLTNASFANEEDITIKVSGNKRIESETIRTFFRDRDLNDQKQVNGVIKELYNTNIFSEVVVRKSENIIKVDVKENPLINNIIFVGNKKLGSDTLKKELQLVERSVFTKDILQSDLKRITEIYKRSGFINVTINPRVKFMDQNRIDLYFDVKEGNKVKIEKIYFHGNEKFSNKELKRKISSKERKWYRGSAENYDPDKLLFDKELLRRFYNNNGYADYKAESADVEYVPSRNYFIINFFLNEGETYNFGESEVESQFSNIDTQKIKEHITFKKGEQYSLKELENSQNAIIAYLNDLGFAFVDVKYSLIKDKENQVVSIKFKISKNQKVYIRKITVSGNTMTYDEVIRRELRLFEGDPYSTTKIKESKRRIENLGFFSSVSLLQTPSIDERYMDIEVKVAEKPTGELNFGFGYSTTDKFLGDISLKERNLMGRAHTINLDFQKSSITDKVDVAYKIPNFMDYNFNFGFDVFDIKREYDESSANIDTQGAGIEISYNLQDDLIQKLKYEYKISDIYDVDDDASSFIQEQEGETTLSGISQQLIYNKLNNSFNPTDGHLLKYSAELGTIGGDEKFLQQELYAVKYKTFWKDKLILKSLAQAGYIVGYDSYDVKINHRFFLGGSSLRGFDTAGIGPRDSDGDALGGNLMFKGTLELSFPLGLPEELGFRGSLFSDFGLIRGLDTSYSSGEVDESDSLRLSAGFGIFWSSPLGPIRFDFGNAILKESFDKTEDFRISFGVTF